MHSFHIIFPFPAGADARALASKSSRRLTIVPCDVTSDEQVIAARDFVSETVAKENLGMILFTTYFYKTIMMDKCILQELFYMLSSIKREFSGN